MSRPSSLCPLRSRGRRMSRARFVPDFGRARGSHGHRGHEGSRAMHAKPGLVAAALGLLRVGMGIKERKPAWIWRRRVTPQLARRRITQQRVHLASSLRGSKGLALLVTVSQDLPTAPADDSQLLCSRRGPKVRVPLYRRILPLPAPSSTIPSIRGSHSDHKPGAASF